MGRSGSQTLDGRQWLQVDSWEGCKESAEQTLAEWQGEHVPCREGAVVRWGCSQMGLRANPSLLASCYSATGRPFPFHDMSSLVPGQRSAEPWPWAVA